MNEYPKWERTVVVTSFQITDNSSLSLTPLRSLRYISPASATCYWRKLIKGFASVQLYDVDLSGSETPFETWLLGGNRLKGESNMH